MPKRLYLSKQQLLFFAFALVFILSIFSLVYTFVGEKSGVSSPKAVALAQTTAYPIYLVKELDGYACVFVSSGARLVFKTDIDLRNLRAADAEKIRQGLLIYSEEEMNGFLEDFGS